jgi:hypothetical protein
MKVFRHGITCYMRPKIRRINGGWWVSIARQLLIFLCHTSLVSSETRKVLSKALRLLLKVHHALRNPLLKTALANYDNMIHELVTAMIAICGPHSATGCNSIKYHWPFHWWITRREFGCSANEKSLERMLGEAQKRHFKHTNSRYNVEVTSSFCINFAFIPHAMWYTCTHKCTYFGTLILTMNIRNMNIRNIKY